MTWLLESVAGFLSALIGALGMGGGGVLLIYLTALTDTPQLAAQGINLIFFVPVAVVALIFHCKNRLVKYKLAAMNLITGAAGVFCGFAVAQKIGGDRLSKVFAVFLLALGVKEMLGDIIEKRLKRFREDKDKQGK